MLILIRRCGQKFFIGNNIKITLLRIYSRKVKIEISRKIIFSKFRYVNEYFLDEYGTSLAIKKSIVMRLNHINYAQVSFGIDAPQKINVHREEIYYKIHKKKETAYFAFNLINFIKHFFYSNKKFHVNG